MRIMIIYDTKFGNGRIAMGVLAEILAAMGHALQVAELSGKPNIDRDLDLLVLSTPTHHDAPSKPMIDYLRKHPLAEDMKVAMVTTHSTAVTKSLDRMGRERRGGVTVGTLALKVEDIEGPLAPGFREKLKDFADAIVGS